MSRFTVRDMSKISVMTALMCVLGPLTIPLGPIPFSLLPMMVSLSVCVLGTKNGSAAVLIYLIMGAAGLPVFGGYSGGLGVVAGPTGGYLVGFIFMAFAGGVISDIRPESEVLRFFGLCCGLFVLYQFGTLWFCHLTGWTYRRALAVCVYPFVLQGVSKIFLAVFIAHVVRGRVPSLKM